MLRKMIFQDLDQVLKIQDEGFIIDVLEDRDTYIKYINSYPETCVVIEKEKDIVGYLIFYPFFQNLTSFCNKEDIKGLNSDCLYLHDICIDRNHRFEI